MNFWARYVIYSFNWYFACFLVFLLTGQFEAAGIAFIISALALLFSAILVGRRTALLDNPSLTVRNWYGKNPLRLVIDKNLSLPTDLNLFDKSVPTVVFTAREGISAPNLTYVQLDFSQDILPQIMNELAERKIQSLLVEGGSHLLQSFLNEELWDEIFIEHSEQTLRQGIAAPAVREGYSSDYGIRGGVYMSHYYR